MFSSYVQKTETLQKLLETQLQITEEVENNPNDQKEKTKAAVAAQTDEGDTKTAEGENSTDSERGKKDVACAIVSEERSQSDGDKQEPTGNLEENLKTFSRQKLALVQCEYDPKRCGFCEKIFPLTELRRCTKCKTAKYCSKECQTEDWERRHKKHCKEIRRLQKIVSSLKVSPSGDPHFLSRGVDYGTMHTYEGKILLRGYEPGGYTGCSFVHVYHPTTLMNEETVCRHNIEVRILDYCMINVEDTDYLAASIASQPIQPHLCRLEFWPFTTPANKPAYIFLAPKKGEFYGPMCFSEGKLLIENGRRKTIEEIDMSCFPVKATQLSIPTGIYFPGSLCSMRVIRNDAERLIVMQYFRDAGWDVPKVKCINFQGQELWQFGGLGTPHLDNKLYKPYNICIDNNGNVYTAEYDTNRIVVIRKSSPTPEILFCAPDRVGCIDWCDQSQKLYVAYDIREGVQMAIQAYDIA